MKITREYLENKDFFEWHGSMKKSLTEITWLLLDEYEEYWIVGVKQGSDEVYLFDACETYEIELLYKLLTKTEL